MGSTPSKVNANRASGAGSALGSTSSKMDGEILVTKPWVSPDDIIYEFESKQKLINHLKKKAKVLGAIYSNGKKQSKKNGWKYL